MSKKKKKKAMKKAMKKEEKKAKKKAVKKAVEEEREEKKQGEDWLVKLGEGSVPNVVGVLLGGLLDPGLELEDENWTVEENYTLEDDGSFAVGIPLKSPEHSYVMAVIWEADMGTVDFIAHAVVQRDDGLMMGADGEWKKPEECEPFCFTSVSLCLTASYLADAKSEPSKENMIEVFRLGAVLSKAVLDLTKVYSPWVDYSFHVETDRGIAGVLTLDNELLGITCSLTVSDTCSVAVESSRGSKNVSVSSLQDGVDCIRQNISGKGLSPFY